MISIGNTGTGEENWRDKVALAKAQSSVCRLEKEAEALKERIAELEMELLVAQNRYDELLRKYNDQYSKWGLDPRGMIEDIQKKVDKILTHVEPCPDDDYFETYDNDSKR